MTDRRRLWTGDERRNAVLAAAAAEFAQHGLAGASTARIAERAQIAHSYLFKLFDTKVALFMATTDHVYDRISERFRLAAAQRPGDPLDAMAAAYGDMLGERDDLLVLLHGFAAAGDPRIGPLVRSRYAGLYVQVRTDAGATDDRMRAFWAHGMLLTVAAAIELPLMTGEHAWVATVLGGAADAPGDTRGED
jgi:AcrR family transcriptional regulator